MRRRLMIATAALAATVLAASPAAAKKPDGGGGGGGDDGKVTLLTPTCSLTTGCKFSGNDNNDTAIENAYNQVFTLQSLNLVAVTKLEGAAYKAATGNWTSTTPVDFISVKTGNEFMLYLLPAPSTSGTWSTAGLFNPNGKLRDSVSHISLWRGTVDDLRTAVPEPSAWAVMILGFGAIGAMLRRRRVAVAA